MRTQTLLRLGGAAAIMAGALRLGEPLMRIAFAGNALLTSFFVIDVFLMFGLIAWYAWRADRLGMAGMLGFVLGLVGLMTIRSADLFAGRSGYIVGATLLLIGLVAMNAPALIRWEPPIWPPLLWLVAFVCGLGSLAYGPLAIVAGAIFGVGYIFAGVSLLRG
ncbi:MAG TPA: hypothetical protein VHE09_11705 [Rhizomicrobium sp.]|jgi:hypothetical protein|nr:hypothetical protein [Rhizomicrobium sp.]